MVGDHLSSGEFWTETVMQSSAGVAQNMEKLVAESIKSNYILSDDKKFRDIE